MMTFGSVCSGIEAASVAWHGMGWRAAWLAEIEPFPSAVLAHHYPEVPNLGDMTTIADKVLSGDVVAPDVLVGGTPCQAFSIAGLRQSLDDSRGQLSLEFVRLANAIDSARSIYGKQSAIIVWENVPGVLNTKDNAFGCFLAGLAGESSALQPSGGKWTNAGCVFGPQRAVAWRVLDAQFFGVPQRRRRVFVVASARDAFDPSQILFEFDGVRRDTAPSRKTGQETARNAGCGVKAASYSTMNDPVLTLCASDHKGVGNQTFCDGKIIAQQVSFNRQRSDEYSDQDIASTCTARDYKDATDLVVAYSFDSLASNSMKSANPHSGCREVDLSKTLDSSHPCPSKNQGGIGIVQATYGIPGNWIGRKPENGGNAVEPMHDVAPCLTGADRHGVAVCFQQNTRDEVRLLGGDGQIAGALMADAGAKQQNYICESSDCLNPDKPQCWRVYHPDGVAPALQSSEGRGNAVYVRMAVRRLLPVECERLQGFPDGFTDIPWRTAKEAKLKGFSYESLLLKRGMRLRGPSIEDCPDSPRYKALGNSMAVPCMAWIGKRIAAYVSQQVAA